jgi:hypothetical protein
VAVAAAVLSLAVVYMSYSSGGAGVDETHWKMCYEKGYIVHGAFCHHPGESYVRKDTGVYICRFHPEAVRYSEYYKKLEEDDD